MENQALFSSKVKSKKFKCRLLQFLFGALRVKVCNVWHFPSNFHATPGAKVNWYTFKGSNSAVYSFAFFHNCG